MYYIHKKVMCISNSGGSQNLAGTKTLGSLNRKKNHWAVKFVKTAYYMLGNKNEEERSRTTSTGAGRPLQSNPKQTRFTFPQKLSAFAKWSTEKVAILRDSTRTRTMNHRSMTSAIMLSFLVRVQ